MDLSKFQIEQLLHLSNQVVNYLYEDEIKDYQSSLSKYEIKDIDPKLTSLENFENKLNKSEHIFKYVYNLHKLLGEIAGRKDVTG